jgi:hypothetical protein
MKKFSLFLGSLGGALAGYLLSNEKLRTELSKSKDAESAAKTLGMHLSRDGKKLAKEVKTFVESDDVQKNFKKAKSFAGKKFDEAQKGLKSAMKKGTKQMKAKFAKGKKAVKDKMEG